MDAYEATRVVLSRIQSLDPENAHKIMGLLLLQEHGEQEMIRLAFGPETLLQSVVLKARKELGLAPPPFLLRQSSASRLLAASSSPPSWAPLSVFSRSYSSGNGFGASLDELPSSDELVSPGNPAVSPFCGGGGEGDLIDEFHLPDQLSFLDDLAAAPRSSKSSSGDVLRPDVDCRSPSGNGDGAVFPGGMSWGVNDGFHHRRSSSAVDLCLGDQAAGFGFGWKPCLYYARGFCKNGAGCRFLHGLPDEAAAAAGAKIDAAVEQHCHELLLRSKSQRMAGASQLIAAAFPYSPTGSVPMSPSSSSSKGISSWLQQQQQQSHNESQRAAAAAALDEIHKLMGRSRMERGDLMVNPAARQIYLTFPADSTFSEEDVSNYFSIYGVVQDVRIPYQQKRMFGFVTFVYPETVRLILAKGNPHFVCDSRVLVKPYKEKGKVPDKFRKQQQQQAESYDLQHLGARMFYNNGIANHDLLLRRKLEEQQQAADLQRAIELEGRRFMGLQLLDLNNRSLSSSAPAFINSPTTAAAAAVARSISTTDSSNGSSREEDSPTEGDIDPSSLEHQNCQVRESPPSMEAPLADHEPSFSFPFPTFA